MICGGENGEIEGAKRLDDLRSNLQTSERLMADDIANNNNTFKKKEESGQDCGLIGQRRIGNAHNGCWTRRPVLTLDGSTIQTNSTAENGRSDRAAFSFGYSGAPWSIPNWERREKDGADGGDETGKTSECGIGVGSVPVNAEKGENSQSVSTWREESEDAASWSEKASILETPKAEQPDTAMSILAFEMDPETIFAQLLAGSRASVAHENIQGGSSGVEEIGDEEDLRACKAVWHERYSLSKRASSPSSSSSSSLLSDAESIRLIGTDEDEEQVFQSNPSSQESEVEQQYEENGKKKKSKHSFSIVSKTGDVGKADENCDSSSDDGSLASSTSCSEDSFEMGTVLPSTISARPNDTYTHFHNSLRLSPLKDEEDTMDGEEMSCARDSTEPANEEKMEDNNNRGVELGKVGDNEMATVQSEISPSCLSSVAVLSSNGTTSLTSTSSRQRQSISEELSALDTALPQLDFEKLEKHLNDAAREREMNQRKLMGEHVLRRLVMDPSDQPRYHPPAPTRRPLRSNLGARLQSGMSLQICFMNDVAPTDDDDDEEETEWADDEDESTNGGAAVPKSRSTPNLGTPSTSAGTVGRSISSCGDSAKRASELRRSVLERQRSEDHDFTLRQARLEEEAKVMLMKAKEAARMQMDLERQEKAKECTIERLVGVPGLGKRKLTRLQLTRMNVTQLQIILNDLHSKIEALNEELVRLLMERDSLHMEQDSMLVDIEDLLQHHRSMDLSLPDFLIADPVLSPSSINGTNNNNNHKHTRFRIFKR